MWRQGRPRLQWLRRRRVRETDVSLLTLKATESADVRLEVNDSDSWAWFWVAFL